MQFMCLRQLCILLARKAIKIFSLLFYYALDVAGPIQNAIFTANWMFLHKVIN